MLADESYKIAEKSRQELFHLSPPNREHFKGPCRHFADAAELELLLEPEPATV
jgi:hypothetical protein